LYKQLEEKGRIIVTLLEIIAFQEQATKPFIVFLKENISSRFSSSSNVVLGMSIFDPRKAPKADLPDLRTTHGDEAIATLLAHYGSEKLAEMLQGTSTNREAVITPDITTEWKTYHQLFVRKPETDMKAQLKKLASHDMIKTLFNNLKNRHNLPFHPCHDSFSRKKLFFK